MSATPRMCRECDFARSVPGRSEANPLGEFLCDECADARAVREAEREYRERAARRAAARRILRAA